jgi:two-component system, NtrC family, sensor kinase
MRRVGLAYVSRVMNQHEPNTTHEPSTILVADDNIELREIARELLQSEGYTVLEAASGEEAVRIATEKRPDLSIA